MNTTIDNARAVTMIAIIAVTIKMFDDCSFKSPFTVSPKPLSSQDSIRCLYRTTIDIIFESGISISEDIFGTGIPLSYRTITSA